MHFPDQNLQVDHPHAVSIVVIATPMVSLPVSVHRSVLIALDVFTFRYIVDAVVVRVVRDFVPIEYLACKEKFHAEVFNFVFRSVIFIILFKPKCRLVIKFGIFMILKFKGMRINTNVALHASALPHLRAFSEANMG